jgi:hypothetical protein
MVSDYSLTAAGDGRHGLVEAVAGETSMPQDHCRSGLNFNVEEWSATGLTYETLADCATLELARVVFETAIAKNPAGRFMIRSRTRVMERHPEGDW